MKKYKITIPEPCTENWDKMTPDENGRFCMTCAKTVIDFTSMLPEEIQDYIIKNKNNKICGKFKKSQLDSIIIQIPSGVLYTQTQYHKMFLLALFIAMGTTLFSCQNKDGNKQKIDKIEVIEDSSVVTNSNKQEDSVNNKDPKVNETKITKSKTHSTIKKEKIFSFPKTECGETAANIPIYEDNNVYGVMGIDVLPDYPGGKDVLYDIFRKEFQIPKELRKSTGVLKMSFVIEKKWRFG